MGRQSTGKIRVCQRRFAQRDDIGTVTECLLGALRDTQSTVGDDRHLGRIPAGQFNQACRSSIERRFPGLKFSHMNEINAGVLDRPENDLGASFAFRPFMFVVVYFALGEAYAYGNTCAVPPQRSVRWLV